MTNDVKATILGLVAAVGIAVTPLLQSGHVSWPAVGAAALVAAFGFIANKQDKPAPPSKG